MDSLTRTIHTLALHRFQCVCSIANSNRSIGHLEVANLPPPAYTTLWSPRPDRLNLTSAYASFDPDESLNPYRALMRDGRERLRTYQERRWPVCGQQSPLELSDAGFFYTGILDLVHCAFCPLMLRCWSRGDNPIWEHFKHNRDCRFIQGYDVNNIPVEEDPIRGENPRLPYFDLVETQPRRIHEYEYASSDDDSQTMDRFDPGFEE